jgi:cytoskeleton protein RodZ
MTAQKGASHFGHKLREARERRGLSLRQIANATKISMITLEALERNDIARLPGGIFSRAFVRSYALEVGLDPESTIEEFMGQFPHDSVTAGHPTTTQIEDIEAVESDQRMASTFLRLILVSVPVAAIVMYFAMFGRRTLAVTAPPVPEVQSTTAPAVVEPHPAPEAAADVAAEAPVEHLVVRVTAAQRCWVAAVVDGQRTVQRTFLPGDEQTLEVSRDLVLTAGDPAALTVTINGKTARPLGPGGQQATVRLTLANFKDYLPAP